MRDDEQKEEPRQDDGSQGERSGGKDVTVALRLLEREADQKQRLHCHKRDCERAPADDQDGESERDQRPDDRGAHEELHEPGGDSEQRRDRACGEQAWHEQDPHFRDQRLDERNGGTEHDQHHGQERELEPHIARVGEEDLRCHDQHEPVAGCCRPLQVSEVAAGVLEQRSLVDHRQFEVRVGAVDRLAAHLGDSDQREGEGAKRQRRARPDLRARCCCDDTHEVSRSRYERCDGESEHERRLDEDREREVAAGADQGEAVAGVPGGNDDGKACEREQAEQQERVVADTETRCGRRCRHDEDGCDQRRADNSGRKPVEDARPCRGDGALSPQPPQLTVGL